MDGNKQQPDESKALQLTQWVMQKAIEGVRVGGQPVLSSSRDLSEKYRRRAKVRSLDEVIDELIHVESAKNFTVGFLTGLGGVLSLPVAIPSDLAASWLIQLRMVAAIAHLRGYDLDDEWVRTALLLTLFATSLDEALSKLGIRVAEKATEQLIARIPREALRSINATVGFQMITKGGTRAPIVLAKGIPIVGGVVGGTIDGLSCYGIGKLAKNFFPDQDADDGQKRGTPLPLVGPNYEGAEEGMPEVFDQATAKAEIP